MAIVDEHGRLFGRFNLIDAVLAVIIAGLIPLAYGAYALFKTPMPRLIAVEPGSLVKGPNLRVAIKGENLRPYMRVSFNNIQGNSFIFRNVGEALVDLNEMPAGEYDVVLFDYAQERSRLPKALTIQPTPLPDSQVIVVGTIGNLTAERATGLKAGMALQGLGIVLEVGTPLPEVTRVFAGPVLEIPVDKAVRVPAVVRVGCSIRAPQGTPQCVIGDTTLQPTAIVFVETPLGRLPFQIDQIRGTQPLEPVTLTVQFEGRPALITQIRRDDVDQGSYFNDLGAGARVTAVSTPRMQTPDYGRVDVTIAAQAQRDTTSWVYATVPLRVGAGLQLRTPRYDLRGTIVAVSPEWSPSRPPAANASGSRE